MATVTDSLTLVPSGNTGLTGMTTSSSYPISNAYHDSSNTSSYCRYTLSTSTTGSVYLTFDTSDIPSDATITSVTAQARLRISSTSRVTNRVCQLYSGTTAKGSSVSFSSTSSSGGAVVTLSPGSSWSRSDLSDLRMLISGTGSSSSQSKYIYIYGADITINYTVTAHNITVNNSTSATVTVSETVIAEGDDVTVFTDTISGIVIKDNGTDITSQFTQAAGGTISAVPESTFTTDVSSSGTNFYQNSSTTSTAWLEYAIGHSAESPYSTSETNNTYAKPEGETAWINYEFDFSSIPTSATINSVSVKVYGARENSSINTTHVARFQCYSGSTAKGTIQDFTSTSNSLVTVTDPGTWTATELHDARLRFEVGYYGGRMLGITWTVTYTVSGYTYTITNISTDHTITVTNSSTTTIYIKLNGSWVAADAVYKKVNGAWVQQSDLTAVFTSGVNYKYEN